MMYPEWIRVCSTGTSQKSTDCFHFSSEYHHKEERQVRILIVVYLRSTDETYQVGRLSAASERLNLTYFSLASEQTSTFTIFMAHEHSSFVCFFVSADLDKKKSCLWCCPPTSTMKTILPHVQSFRMEEGSFFSYHTTAVFRNPLMFVSQEIRAALPYFCFIFFHSSTTMLGGPM